jgi:dephospho-CoA kinase
MLKVGLTGSIAVGKSTVCGIFRELGCHVLDADKTAREVVEPGTNAFQDIVEAFGSEVVASDGSLDRSRLGSIVFADETKRQLLNSIVHPRVIARQNEWLDKLEDSDPDGIAIIDAALMIESGGYKRFNKLIVVWCNADIQISRLMRRDGFSRDEAERRIASQMPQDEKKRYADFLIDTSDDIAATRQQVLQIFDELKNLDPIDAAHGKDRDQ